jgi:diguanylate cyclase (GGDEF)-like protein
MMKGRMGKDSTVATVTSKIQLRPASTHAALVVIYGLELGVKYDLMRPTVIIGRSLKADIRVDQASVSRQHSRLTCGAKGVTLVDLGSKNGTYVNDQFIETEVRLRHGDLIKTGRAIFRFIAGGNIESAYYDEMQRLTTLDGLTQVYNRRYLEAALEREISRANRYQRNLALLLIDVDCFKQINDTHGHIAGDDVLHQVGSRIRSQVRLEDTPARYGGDEFALLLPETNAKSAQHTAERIRKIVARGPVRSGGFDIPVSISVGVAVLAPDVRTAADLVRSADEKLYRAKNRGRNRVCR